MEKYKIDKERALKKWSPILDMLKVENEDKRKLMTEYAERHILNQNIYYCIEGNGMGPIETPDSNILHGTVWGEDLKSSKESEYFQNTLPVSMKIFAKLNLENKQIEFSDDLKTVVLSEELNQEDIDNIKKSNGMDILQKIENTIIDMVVNKINEELENKNTLLINILANNISIISADEWKPRIYVESRYEVK